MNNEWADLHGESPSDFDPEPEPKPNGDWICPRCSERYRTYLKPGIYDYEFCVKDGSRMIWKPDDVAKSAVYCRNCETWVNPSDFNRWTGDDMIHYLCPGCDGDMFEPQTME